VNLTNSTLVMMTRESAVTIKQAAETDLTAIFSFDQITQINQGRQEFIRHAIETGTCFVSVDHAEVIGYGVLEYSFYGNGFISIVYVHPCYRRRHVGYDLIRHMESLCRTKKLFTSTNLSNLPMHTLLEKLGYKLSGVIDNLDPDDPEVVYFKSLENE